jgi:PAS domain S-box-containing protein
MVAVSSDAAQIAAERRFRVMAESAPVLIWSSGVDKGCTYVNHRWLEFTGRTFEQELGAGWAQSVHPDDVAYCVSTYDHAFDARRPFTMEYRLRRHDGEYRWVIDNGAPMFDGARFVGYIGSTLDVTEFRAAQEHIARLNQQLVDAVDEERAWVARELHDDIAQQIAALSIKLDRAIQHVPAAKKDQRELLGEVRDRATELVGSVASLSKKLASAGFSLDKSRS